MAHLVYRPTIVHNPQQVPESKLPPGFRFLDRDEIVPARPRSYAIKCWSEGLVKWADGEARGVNNTRTYCTTLTRKQLRNFTTNYGHI
jgi:hypothetical protein